MTTRQSATTIRAAWRLVVVDDSPDDRAEVRRMLLDGAERRLQFSECETGAAAVRAVLGDPAGPPDCLVIDHYLPDMDAPELIEQLLDAKGFPVCPIVVMTGLVGPEMGRAVLKAGAQDYIGKDWLTPPGMTRAVENAIERYVLTRQIREKDAAVRESEERLRLALEASDTGLWIWDLETDEVTWSPQCYRIHGISAGDFAQTGVGFFLLVHPDDRARVESTVRDAIDRQELYECDFRILRPDDEVRWVTNRGRAACDEQGRPTRMLGTITDVTARRQAEVKARENEALLRVALEAGSCVGFSWDIPEDRVIRFHSTEPAVPVNIEAPCRIADVRAVIHPQDRDRFDAGVQACLAGGVTYQSEFRIIRPDGTVRWLQEAGTLFRDGSGRPLKLTGVSRDVTDQKMGEVALRESEEKLRLALEAAEAGIWESFPSTGEFFASDRALALHGFPPGSPINHELAIQSVHPEDRSRVEEAMRKTLEENAPFRIEIRALLPDGSVRWLASHAELRDVPDRPRLVGLVQDISVRKRVEQNLAFLADLSQAFAPAVSSQDVVRIAADRIRGHYGAARVEFAEIDAAGDRMTFYSGEGASGQGGGPAPCILDEHFGDFLVCELRHGRTAAIDDVQTDPRTAPLATGYSRSDAGSVLLAPGMSDGRWRFLVSVQKTAAYRWSNDEADLLREAAARVHLRLERARAEEALRAAHDTFRHLVDNSPFGVYVVDADFRLVQVSIGARRVFENIRPLIGRDFADVLRVIWPSSFAEFCIDCFRHTLDTGETYHAPSTLERRKDIPEIEAYDWKIERIVLPDGRFGVVCHFYDLSERRRWEAALVAKDRQLQSLADNSPDILVRFDRDLRHVFVNAAVEVASGRKIEEYLGKTNRDLGMPPHLCDLWDGALRKVLETGKPRTIEFAFPTRQGERHYSSRLIPETDSEGMVQYVLGVAHDITEHKLFEAALREQDQRKDVFLATLAHELRNPLAPIRTGLELLRLAPDGDSVAETREMMDRQVGHMVRLIDELMDVSRIGQGKLDLKRERLNLCTVLKRAAEASRPLIEGARHQLTIDLPDRPIWIDGDSVRVSQIFSNLLNNAAKYTQKGGRIELAARLERGQATVSVRDNGAGISSVMLPRIFEMFTQVDGTLDRAQGGLGIGLSLVQKLVKAHGGTVEAESEGMGLGSVFTVRLPAAASPTIGDEAGLVNGPQTDSAAKPRLRVLVVDDNEDGALTLAMLVKVFGHDVRVSQNGEVALRLIAELRPDVVLLDLGLPDIDGHEICRRIRRDPECSSVMIVALTGRATDEDRSKTRESGFDFHLAKPCDLEQIESLLSRAAMRRR